MRLPVVGRECSPVKFASHCTNQDCGLNKRKNPRVIGLRDYGIIKLSEEVARGSFWKSFYPVREICSNRMRRRVMKGVFLKTITTCASGKGHFIDVSLVYWKTFAHPQAAFIINSAKLLLRQHGANKNKRATSSALMAFPFS